MTKTKFASQSSLIRWAGTHDTMSVENVLVVPKDGLFWYFSLDDEHYYVLLMSSERNIFEE